MATKIQEKMVEVQDAIFKEGFYVDRYIQALKNLNMSVASIDQHEYRDAKLARLCHAFWELLPDSPEIRRQPFFKLCDIASGIFDETSP